MSLIGTAAYLSLVFEGFALEQLELDEVTVRVRIGGDGPPLLLLHGHPQTHAMWHLVAPQLASKFTVVAPDLRGYGQSTAPRATDDHSTGSKRAMARDAIQLMDRLGFPRFGVAGHDRGGRVAYRLALDHPAAVTRLAVLDIIPTGEVWARMDAELAQEFWHWLFLARRSPLPERLLAADPDAYYFSADRTLFAPDALKDYLASCHIPSTVHTMCEDYRAGATIDRVLDDADRVAGRRIDCPILVLWSAGERHDRWYEPLAVWRAWATDPDTVRGRSIDSGHYLAEEAPREVTAELEAFFGAG